MREQIVSGQGAQAADWAVSSRFLRLANATVMSALTDESPRLPHGTDKTQTRCTALGPSHCIERGRVSPRTLNWKVLAQSHNLEGSAGVHKPVGGNVNATHAHLFVLSVFDCFRVVF